jgi:hypothetical protein
MLSDALSFPRGGDDWLPTLLLGGVLTVLGFLILPALVVQGYLVRVANHAAGGERTPPSFTRWGELLVDGVKLFVVTLVYGLLVVVPFVLLTVAVAVFVVPAGPETAIAEGAPASATGATPGGGGGAALALFALALVVLGVAGVLVAYLLPAAVANFAIEGRLRAAFALRTVVAGALTTDYAVAWVLAVVVAVVGSLVGSALTAVVVGVFVLFYVQVVVVYLVGRGFAAGLSTKRWSEP